MSAKVCTFCKKKFWSKSAVKKYCSSACAKKPRKNVKETTSNCVLVAKTHVEGVTGVETFRP